MAYALKYHHNFFQMKNYTTDEWRIEIYLEGYGGAATELEHVQAGSITIDREGDLLDGVRGSKLKFGLYNETEAQYKEFRTASYGDYKVILIKDPSGTAETKFIGYNQSEIYTESYALEGTLGLEFTCGLSHLRHVRFDNSGTLYTGKKSIIEVLRLCLNKLASPLAIREFVNIYEDSITATTANSMMNQIYVDVAVYKEEGKEGGATEEVGFFCHQVIEEILKPFQAHIYQANGIWHIIRTQEYLDSIMYYRDFNANVGTESTITIDGNGSLTTNKKTVTGKNGLSTELILQSDGAEMSIDPPLNRVKVTYNLENFDQDANNLIRNGHFGHITTTPPLGTDPTPAFWTVTGSDTTTYNAISGFSGNSFHFRFEPVAQATATAFDSGVHLSQVRLGVPTDITDSLEFSMDYRVDWECSVKNGQNTLTSVNNFFNNDMFVAFEVEMTFGAYYLAGDATAGFSWTTTPSRATFKKTGFDVGGAIFVLNYNQSTYIAETLPTLPQNAVVNFGVKIYRAYSNISTFMATVSANYNYTFGSIWLRNFDVLYLPDELPPVDEMIVYSEIDEDENLLEIETLHGDGTNSVTLNSFRLSSGAITDVWNRRGVSDNADILIVLLKQLRDLRGEFIRILSGTLIGEIDVFNTIEDTTDVTTHYYIQSYSWKVESNQYNVTLSELVNSSNPLTTTISALPAPAGFDVTTSVDQGGGAPPPTAKIVSPTTATSVNQGNLTNYN